MHNRYSQWIGLGAATLGFLIAMAAPARAQLAANVTINADTSLGTIPATAFGVNTAAWDGYLLDSDIPALLEKANINLIRYPGGSTSDVYHWATNTCLNGGYTDPSDTFDNFMGVAKASNAHPIITVNYGSNIAGTAGGDPAEAAAWVKYSNITKKYGVTYWEIGNEVYGNQEYGGDWEEDLHADQSPTAYGNNVLLYAAAMKAVDKTIKVGAVLTAPGNWPDGVAPAWNPNVLMQCGSKIDFVILHWYAQGPGSESDAGLLSSTSQIANMVAQTRSLINQYCGTNAPNVQIFVTETNSVAYNPGKQSVSLVNGLFLADDVMDWLEHGVANVDLWDLHNGPSTGNNNSPSLYGTANYGDYGMLSSGWSPEPAADTPFPTYYALQSLTNLGKAGDAMVSSTSSRPLLAVHAAKRAAGYLELLLINKDPANSYKAAVSASGYIAGPQGTTYTYGEGSTGIASKSTIGLGSSFSVTVAPYSLTVVVLHPVATAAPTNLKATTGGPTVPLTWTAPSGTVTQYYLYRSTKPGGEGATPIKTGITATSYTDTTAVVGTTYYYKVAAENPTAVSPLSNEATATP